MGKVKKIDSESSTSELTYKVIAYQEIDNFNSDDCVDWAIDMLKKGYETESLLILSSISKPTNQFETISYLQKAFGELNLKEKIGEEAIVSYCSYYIIKLSNSINLRVNLEHIYKFCQRKDYEGVLYDFYKLYWAWQDLDYDENNHYWETAEKSNIDKIVIEVAKKWLVENKKYYAQ